MAQRLMNYALDTWVEGDGDQATALSAISGEVVALYSSNGLNFGAMLEHARTVGGPALRQLTFHQRANILKGLAQAIGARKEELYELAKATGATRADNWIDIEGGSGTLFSFASKGKRELPNGHIIVDGDPEIVSKGGTFIGQHVYTSMQGCAVHINAYNFPVWGMLEKIAPALLAGVPAIVKPATSTGYVTEAAVRIMIETGLLPDGALQLIMGPVGDLFEHLTGQDIVSFTGSAATAAKLKGHPSVIRESVRFVAEQDSLNASILGPDAVPGTPEFDLFIKEVAREITVKAGQKCTAIRRAMVPTAHMDAVETALKARLAQVVVGDPATEGVTMGALASSVARDAVLSNVARLAEESRIVFGDLNGVAGPGAFLSPILLRNDEPWQATSLHDVEAFGPVATLFPYVDLPDAIALANRGMGSLVVSLFTYDHSIARDFVMGSGALHGRIVILDRDSAKESTGHGSPLPVLVHGGPGRAGGGEELGGTRAVHHYMQRTAVQAHPSTISAITGTYVQGAAQIEADVHPFRKRFGELPIGYTLKTDARTITLEDIEHFAHFTGDTFYAHMDQEAAARSPIFGGRVAHGYLILSFAAGLFVDPAEGPVLANYGLEGLRFVKPLKPGSSIRVELTVKEKKQRDAAQGEVKWQARVIDGDGELAAIYDLLTMNAV